MTLPLAWRMQSGLMASGSNLLQGDAMSLSGILCHW